jgi:probable F420-dependent oxidoreductase
MADPFVSLMAAAGVTEQLKLGTGICLVVEHDPIVLAKTVATLDRLSDGRVILGIGAGWNAEEMENHGTPFKRRWTVLRERVEAMKAIWTQEEASYTGEFVNFERIVSHPKPVQRPHPPIIMGSATARGRARVVEYCDGWIPIDVLMEDLPGHLVSLKAEAEAADRDPASISVSVFAFDGADGDALKRYRDMGLDRAVLIAPRREADALRFVDRFAELVPELA